MNTKVKALNGNFGTRFAAINFSEDGGISVNFQLVSIKQLPRDPESPAAPPQYAFEKIAESGYYLSQTDGALVLDLPIDEDGEQGLSLRDILETRIENLLREHGQIKF